MDPYEMAIFGTHAVDKAIPVPRLSLPAVVTYDGISLLALAALQAICQTCFQSGSASSALLQLSLILWLMMLVFCVVELAMLICTVHFGSSCWSLRVLIAVCGSWGNMEGRWRGVLLLVCSRFDGVAYGASVDLV